MVLIVDENEFDGTNYVAGFRPLTGIMVLITVKGKEDTNVICGEFPSPYGDYGSYLPSNVL